MSDEDLLQQLLGIELLGKQVKFAHEVQSDTSYKVQSVDWKGMVTLEGCAGEFAPHIFVAAKLTRTEHRDRHRFLHRNYDELLSDYVLHHRGSVPLSDHGRRSFGVVRQTNAKTGRVQISIGEMMGNTIPPPLKPGQQVIVMEMTEQRKQRIKAAYSACKNLLCALTEGPMEAFHVLEILKKSLEETEKLTFDGSISLDDVIPKGIGKLVTHTKRIISELRAVIGYKLLFAAIGVFPEEEGLILAKALSRVADELNAVRPAPPPLGPAARP
ncbi:MAG TPA: hypothetical protein VHA06_21140 [Candidatus Angelobacter sp.]|nr:hypothetical protein [Candidatus Angelobacter sp.]